MATPYKVKESRIDDISLLEPEAIYSYADYLKWTFEERVELIKGKLFKMSPAPRRTHQEIDSRLHVEIGTFLKGKSCHLYSAPFDVRFPNLTNDPDDQTFTVVQPDLCVVCDPAKLDDAGCKGAPDLVVEILSPTTASKDLNEKYRLYEEHGVKEYWVVYPGENVLEIYELIDGKYISRGKFVREDQVRSNVLKGLVLNLEDVFEEVG
ncbi:Uma2 family endonuclease [Marinoscillum sp. 108]|uniref:Uma2 family endonuclease n=1 Tax=Marinoscillum sp. 108 TaxID=2653151 RepID=UPI0012F333B2|nr:Uma2 family endonuclease [Marinoscillum sp. 108]VXD16168.1 Restriction endonuclease [Marinoscillum sp. 108]